jgi:dTDP-N-acetylfucosamine:lipid II N-acetylfucosaminyltransferase
MIVAHLINDEKFIDFFSNSAKNLENIEHQFILIIENKFHQTKYVKSTPIFKRVEPTFPNSFRIIKYINECDAVVIHQMTPFIARIVPFIRKRVVVVWSGWGADYYSFLPGIEDKLYFSQTKAISKNIKNPSANLIKSSLKTVIHKAFDPLMLRRINIFSSPIPCDFYKLKESLRFFKAEYAQINYGSVEKTFSVGIQTVSGDNILIGNSASLTNNHLEAFETIAKLDISKRKIIVPLSYGDRDYKNFVIGKGYDYFGDNFQPITDFVSLAEYNRLIASCSIAIMNHKRQQALANIGTLLLAGTKVFLNKENPIYEFFTTRKATIFNTTELDTTNKELFRPLSNNEIENNRQVLSEFWGEKTVEKNLIHLFNKIKQITNAQI